MTQSLVIGASGLVGEHLVTVLRSAGQAPVSTYHSDLIPSASALDITQQANVLGLLESAKPGFVYLPAALTNVDYCENHPEETYEINVRGVQNVVKAVNAIGSKLIYFSSDYIFDGVSGPYDETDSANPICEYGRQKLAAEHYISLFAKQYLVIRTTVVYGWERKGKNFVYNLIRSLKSGNSIRVPVDQIGSPTYAKNLAQIAVELAAVPLNDVINITGPDRISRFELARLVAKTFKLDEKLITPVETNQLGQPAKRPLEAGLKIAKVTAVSQIPLINFSEGLKLMVDDQGQLNS